jgi:hypothetical protein
MFILWKFQFISVIPKLLIPDFINSMLCLAIHYYISSTLSRYHILLHTLLHWHGCWNTLPKLIAVVRLRKLSPHVQLLIKTCHCCLKNDESGLRIAFNCVPQCSVGLPISPKLSSPSSVPSSQILYFQYPSNRHLVALLEFDTWVGVKRTSCAIWSNLGCKRLFTSISPLASSLTKTGKHEMRT